MTAESVKRLVLDGKLAKGIWTGEITIKDLFGSLKDQVRKEFVEPFEYIKKNYKKGWEGNVSYEEAQEFGKNLAKAVQVVAAAVTLGVGAAVKIASKLPKLMKGVEDALLNAPVKRGELQDRVVKGKGDFDITKPSKTPSPYAVPAGTKTKINPKNDAETIRSLERENESAEILAKRGYDITQNPVMPTTNKKPDYLIEGKIFDCYAPSKNTSVRSIWSNIKVGKVDAGQTDRIVLNLKDWSGNIEDLKKQFSDYPMDGLKEVIVITKDDSVFNLILK
ncbi:hypothetical protein [Paenibacillus sp. NEAU-GSW1]|uniref:CdiA C-terminal domain-containing protein n=1 Tax=Paenibacillus sp. NEAU-GSW1 TaxID=2682486 RepID=UPI0012E2AF10|nr:hypothetical protein [Paenibacillus sp. NEAU-GSW1]